MRPYLLKRDILYYAIQGKLVEQNPSEGTGQILIAENNKKKASYPLDVQKKIGKACKPIQETDLLFDIPNTWVWERFGNLVINYDSQRRPVTKSDRKTTKGLYDYYGATGAIDKVDDFIFDGEYLMIGEDGGNFYVERDNSFIARGCFWANNHVHVVKPIVCDIEYLKVCLDALDFPNLGLINGIAVPKLNQENMNSILVPVPPLIEQKRIVAKIEELLPLIDRYEAAWSRLEEFNKRFPGDMQKSILQMAIQGKLVEQRPEEGTGEELYKQIQNEKSVLAKKGEIYREKASKCIDEDDLPFEIPSSWIWCRLGDLAKVITKGSSPAWQGISYTDETRGVLFVTSENVGNNEMLLSKRKYVERKFNEMHPASILKRGDILTNLVGASIGRTAVFNENIADANINQAVCIIRLVSDSIRNYILKYLRCNTAIKTMLNDTVDTARANLSLTSVTNLLIPLPPLAEQKRIVTKLEELLPLCEKIKS